MVSLIYGIDLKLFMVMNMRSICKFMNSFHFNILALFITCDVVLCDSHVCFGVYDIQMFVTPDVTVVSQDH